MKINGFDVLNIQKELFRVPKINNDKTYLVVDNKQHLEAKLKGYLICSGLSIQKDYIVLTFLEADGKNYVCFSSSIYHKSTSELFPESVNCFGKTYKTGKLVTKKIIKDMFFNKFDEYFKYDAFLEYESILIPMLCLSLSRYIKRICYVNEKLEPLELGVYDTVKNEYISFIDK